MQAKRRVAILLAVVILSCGLAYSQTVSGIINGSVVDASGSAVAGATIKLTNDKTGDHREMQTDANGEFLFSSILPGRYRIVIEMLGFKRIEKSDLNITAAERLSAGKMKRRYRGTGTSGAYLNCTAASPQPGLSTFPG